ncbi:hypothetical protein C8F04DRAFT_1248514 [Mycena alexandri]|uniref:F-box domain-containing protein n=1 Tax=Mycena alexandri TaxID=1745969 RepID=A0AAD6TLA1_9AGAR|nr:hypothetical protein C8F04DRAFT_1248514 [Mycena alexandri]
MSNALLPHPSWEFYFKNNHRADKFLGFFDYGRDYELALVPSTTQGNTWHYRNCGDGSLLRALLLGEVVESLTVQALLGEQHDESGGVKLRVKCVSNPSAKTARAFANDHAQLREVVATEDSRPLSTADSWVETLSGEDHFFLEYSPLTTVVNGPVRHGSKILIDASLSRLDICSDNTGSRKVYRIWAHEIECISEAYLAIFGVIVDETGSVQAGEVELNAEMEGALRDHTMKVNDGYEQVEKFIRRVRGCQYNEHTEEYFTRISNDVLFLAAVEDPECWERVMTWVGSCSYAPADLSRAGVLETLPAELVYRIIGHMGLRSRVVFARTSKCIKYLCTSLAHCELGVICANYDLDFARVRFMLVATQTCMAGFALQSVFAGPVLNEDSLDFFAGPGWAQYVIRFLLRLNNYTADPTPMVNGGYMSTSLRSPTRLIRVITCPRTALQGVTSQNHTARFGYCDGYRIRHAYAELVDERVTISTPGLMSIADDLMAHVEAWKAIHKALRHGLSWASDYWKPHACNNKQCFSCPVNLRDTLDGGWFQLSLFDTAYDANRAIQLVAWPFFGVGCKKGTIRGQKFRKVICESDVEWKATMLALEQMESPPTVLRRYS